MTTLDDGTTWRDFANCATTNPDAFFPAAGEPLNAAKKVCSECLVRTECLEYALETNQTVGIWGGLSAHERRLLRAGVA